jgi:hypothetical protein
VCPKLFTHNIVTVFLVDRMEGYRLNCND